MSRKSLFIATLAVSLVAAFLGCRDTFNPASVNEASLDRNSAGQGNSEAPYVIIDKPTPPAGGRIQVLGKVIVFGWHSGLTTEPHSVRWLCVQVRDTSGNYNPSFDIVRDLNQNPWRYEGYWSKWVPYNNPHGRTTTVGLEDTLAFNRSYIFAVQARDLSGNVTTTFDRRANVRQFIVSLSAAPFLRVTESFIGGFAFLGLNTRTLEVPFPQGLEMKFTWTADASAYGGEIIGYRYGWDVADVNRKQDWKMKWSLDATSAPPTVFQSGDHTLYVEALDNMGGITLGRISVTIVPFTMEKNLLWVDDYYTTDRAQTDYSQPTLTEYREFWLENCAKAAGFDPVRDVYDVYRDHNVKAPPLSLITQYKNIIWSYSSLSDQGVWDDVIKFTPESMIGAVEAPAVNYLALFLAKGGHLLTEGCAERTGGLAAALLPFAQIFPMSLKCDITGPSQDCGPDQSGVSSMPYRDYCVTVIDKIVGTIRSDPAMPMRQVRNYDVLTTALKSDDPVAGSLPGLPDSLALWSEITETGRYFNPLMPSPYPGGYTYVEMYDPAYWMSARGYSSQPCFHPLFRMRSKNTLSAVDNTAIALCLTKYENVVPQVTAGVAAPARSFHFGTELWFFDRQHVNQIMDVVFTEWGIGN